MAAFAEAVGLVLHRQVTGAAGSFAWALHPRAGTAAGTVGSAAPAVWEAAADVSPDRGVEYPCPANQDDRAVAAASLARFCLMPQRHRTRLSDRTC